MFFGGEGIIAENNPEDVKAMSPYMTGYIKDLVNI